MHLAVAAVACALGAEGAPSPIPRPSSLRLTGTASVPAQRIRQCLAGDFQYCLAVAEGCSAEQYAKLVEERIAEGYRAAGYADVEVRAAREQARGEWQVRVTEGPRYLFGRVLPEGNRNLSTQAITDALSQFQDMEGELAATPGSLSAVAATSLGRIKPPWRPGEPADVSKVNMAKVVARVGKAYASAGYFATSFDMEEERRTEGRQAFLDLRLRFRDTLPHARLTSVTVTGLDRNTRDDLLRTLGIAEGEPITLQMVEDARARLKECARFRTSEIVQKMAGEELGAVSLAIRVEEMPGVPPLNEPFPPVKRVLQAVCRRLNAPEEWREDLVVDVRRPGGATAATLVFRPNEGILVSAAIAEGRSVRFMADTSGIRAFVRANDGTRTWVFPSIGQVLATVKVVPIADPDSERKWTLTMGVGASTQDSGVPFKAEIDIAPSAFAGDLSKFEKAFGKGTVTDGELTASKDGITFEAHEATGTFELRTRQAKGEINVRFEEGAYALRKAEMTAPGGLDFSRTHDHKATEAARALIKLFRGAMALTKDVHDAVADPADEVDAKTASWLAEKDASANRFLDVLNQLVRHGLFTGLDGLLARKLPGAGPDALVFRIPADTGVTPELRNVIAAALVKLPPAVFPIDSWPCALARIHAFGMTGKRQAANRELNALLARQDIGPVGWRLIARTFPRQPRLAAHCNQRARSCASPEDLRKDIDLVVGHNPYVDAVARGLLECLRAGSVRTALGPLDHDPLREWLPEAERVAAAMPDASVRDVVFEVVKPFWATLTAGGGTDGDSSAQPPGGPAVLLHIIVLRPDGKSAGRVEETVRVIQEAVAADRSFGVLARTYSDDPSAERDGRLGWLEPGKLHPAFTKAIDGLAEGQVSQPFGLGGAVCVVQVAGRRGEGAAD